MLKNFISEFKEFAVRGNVIDMAVGIIIGGAFSPIVNSLVKDIIMPPIGFVLGNVDFSNLYVPLSLSAPKYSTVSEAQAAGIVTVNYGLFFNTLISFIIVAFSVFIVVKAINKLKNFNKQEKCRQDASVTKECPYCYSSVNIKATRCPYCTSEIK